MSPLRWQHDTLYLLDQAELPHEEIWLKIVSWEGVAEAIRTMQVRGAPAIGIAAAYGIALGMQGTYSGDDRAARFSRVAATLRETRPTAVNLFWAIERMERLFNEQADSPGLPALLADEAAAIHTEDIEANRRLGEHGSRVLPSGARVLTICNAGGLATGGYGTALGVIREAHQSGKLSMVYACETRPRLQGARLTAWELTHEKIPFQLIVDSAAGRLMVEKKIDAVIVGADRIARNGDTANKIGTYTLAVLADRHKVPFYVVAPQSTIDRATLSGEGIPIEERSAEEVLAPFGTAIAPAGTAAWNPAFDVTPAELITAIITEAGVHRPPYSFSECEVARS